MINCYNKIMKERIPETIKLLANACPFPLYLVGGAVRDALCGVKCSADWDLSAPCSYDEFRKIAENCGFITQSVYKNTGTVNISKGDIKIEFTAFRTDKYKRGEHAPCDVVFTTDIEVDAKRRDFKCNAVYYDIKEEKFVDVLGGIADIENKVISTTRDADEVFSEDALRLMRLARQAAQLGFTPDLPTIFGAKFNASLINKISVERIWAELLLILHADEKYNQEYAHYNGFKVLEATNLLNYILPELAIGKDMPQRPDFHNHDVLEHSLRVLKYSDEKVRLAALLHDIGKPYCYNTFGNYHGHEIEGAKIAENVLLRLKAPKKVIEQTTRLIKTHMYDLNGLINENKIRAFIVKNYDIYPLILLIKQADYSGCKDDLNPCPTLIRWTKIHEKMIANKTPFSLKELAVGGNDLKGVVKDFNIGKVLNELLIICAKNPALNNKRTLLKHAIQIEKQGENL